MGRSPKPLRILVAPYMKAWPEFAELVAKGHTVHDLPEGDWWSYDLIAGDRCWRMDEKLRQYMELMVKEARKMRYPKGETP